MIIIYFLKKYIILFPRKWYDNKINIIYVLIGWKKDKTNIFVREYFEEKNEAVNTGN